MYGSNQSDPQQPEWRLPARRPIPTSEPAPPPQPPRPPTSGAIYHSASYGPTSNTNNAVRPNVSSSPVSPLSGMTDPRTWGVQYNKHTIHAPPPLPPRPPSTNEQPNLYAPPPQSQSQPHSPALNPNIPPPSVSHQTYEAFADARPPSANSIPPPYNFPPRENQAPSPQYQIPNVPPPPPKIPQDQPAASQQPNTIRPPLLAQGIGPAATQGSYGRASDPHAAPAFSSALGPGTPSDWEHLGPTEGDFDDAPWFPPRDLAPPSPETIQTPPGFSTGLSRPVATNVSTSQPPANPHQQAYGPTSQPPANPSQQAYGSTSQPPANPTQPAYSPISQPPVNPIQQTYGSTSQSPVNPSQQAYGSTSQPPANPIQQAYNSTYQTPRPQKNDPVSPVSPSTGHRLHAAPLNRMDSVSSSSTWSQRTESIDNVIDAWVKPLEPAPKATESDKASSISHLDLPSRSAQNSPVESPKPQSPLPDRGPTPNTESPAEVRGNIVHQPVDPYEDLDPWFKSSLTRCVAMLRKEAVADSDEERFKIFTAFMAKETKLREIMYNIEHEPPVVQEDRSSRAPQRSSISEERKPPIESGLIPVETEEVESPTKICEDVHDDDDDDDDDDAGSEYSAGGRPIMSKEPGRGSSSQKPRLSIFPEEEEKPKHPARTYSMHLSEEQPPLEPLASEPPRPIYTPFQYTEGPQRGSDNLTFARPAYQAYSDLRQASATGRVMSNVPPQSESASLTTSTSPSELDETFIGLIRHKSNAYQAISRRTASPLPSLPESLRQGRKEDLLDDLRTLVRTPLDNQPESPWHSTARESFGKFSDDLSYVQKSIDDWEHAATERRHKLDDDRATRQEQSEAHIDTLFNDKEIGYADINTLEENFRQTEARTQLDEERKEVDDFISQVFNPVDKRLKDEISALRKSYESAVNQLDRDQKAKSTTSDRHSPSVTMKMVYEIHSQLEIRFQKRLELALDCERRRKRAERRPLVFMGDMASLRQLDGDFDLMEKRNILEAAKDRDGRANQLMDSFDDAILHGLGMNQSLLDELSSKAARLDSTNLRASGLPDSEIEQILRSVTTFAVSLRADSEAILRMSGVAEKALNDADYAVSVAEARYANSEPDIFERLKAEKKKEDSILDRDLDSKLQSIQKGPQALDATIQRLIRDLAKTPRVAAPVSVVIEEATPVSQSVGVPSLELPLELRPATVRPPTVAPSHTPPARRLSDPKDEHQDRLRRALEDAKKRNAAKSSQ
ncbi:uncharacterized protein N7503_003941 [Penicillium pulvis]|uniref:uncharacterized protein n=1 Tax=Penicillium pulvis TaxID=1562058 RepID=UPI00254830C3|nr:uncharacterized protein N7503_003941 [Penicillium pulvis]KAJ5806339.1 hypothetical protein N7503_003941 [Penicillium pulvis]